MLEIRQAIQKVHLVVITICFRNCIHFDVSDVFPDTVADASVEIPKNILQLIK